jgi:hypothetical protein
MPIRFPKLYTPRLPVEDLLDWSAGGISLWKHGDDDVGSEPLTTGNLVYNLLRNLHGNGVVTVGIRVGRPGVGGAQEVLVLDVDEVLGISNALKITQRYNYNNEKQKQGVNQYLNVGLRYRRVYNPSFLAVHLACPGRVKDSRV